MLQQSVLLMVAVNCTMTVSNRMDQARWAEQQHHAHLDGWLLMASESSMLMLRASGSCLQRSGAAAQLYFLFKAVTVRVQHVPRFDPLDVRTDSRQLYRQEEQILFSYGIYCFEACLLL